MHAKTAKHKGLLGLDEENKGIFLFFVIKKSSFLTPTMFKGKIQRGRNPLTCFLCHVDLVLTK